MQMQGRAPWDGTALAEQVASEPGWWIDAFTYSSTIRTVAASATDRYTIPIEPDAECIKPLRNPTQARRPLRRQRALRVVGPRLAALTGQAVSDEVQLNA